MLLEHVETHVAQHVASLKALAVIPVHRAVATAVQVAKRRPLNPTAPYLATSSHPITHKHTHTHTCTGNNADSAAGDERSQHIRNRYVNYLGR